MITRRSFLQVLGVGGAALGLDSLISQTLAHAPPTAFSPTNRDPVAHAINRMTFGITPDLYEHVHRIGVEAFIEEQLNPQTIDDSVTEEALNAFPVLSMSTADIFDEYRNNVGRVYQEMVMGTVIRAVLSNRALNEVMVEFWSDHFSVYLRKNPVVFLKPADDREAIRSHALGNFRDILGVSAKSPAMLMYLDNAQSNARNPNENYSRELLELHTLGVNGGYTENDVQEVARVFTGWSINRQEEGRGITGGFTFRRAFHDDGNKVVLGTTINTTGIQEGEQVLDILAAHPSTANFIATKLVRRFVADAPPQSLVDAVAQTFLQTDGDTKAMLRTIFASEEFWAAPPKYKRPFNFVVGLLRSLEYQSQNQQQFMRSVLEALNEMGHVPFNWAAPNGYPDIGAYWMQNLLPRWNAAINIAMPRRSGSPNYERILQLAQASDLDGVAFLAYYLLGRRLSAEEERILLDFQNNLDADNQTKQLMSVALILASPAYQYR